MSDDDRRGREDHRRSRPRERSTSRRRKLSIKRGTVEYTTTDTTEYDDGTKEMKSTARRLSVRRSSVGYEKRKIKGPSEPANSPPTQLINSPPAQPAIEYPPELEGNPIHELPQAIEQPSELVGDPGHELPREQAYNRSGARAAPERDRNICQADAIRATKTSRDRPSLPQTVASPRRRRLTPAPNRGG